MLGRTGRSITAAIFGPVAKLCVKLGISANVITVFGTVANISAAWLLIPNNYLITGTIIVGLLAFFDSLDGQIARLQKKENPWGAFLDSTLDRISDGAIFASLIAWGYLQADEPVKIWVMSGGLAALLFASVVPYARARAEAIGMTATVGIAERTDRLILAAICAVLVGLGLPHYILAGGLWAVAVLSFITVIQRMVAVYRQCKELEK
ncbi:MAG: CDP-alcohol phosphatidyltransferase family protein [Arcanobacterium sp.]|nr:CDP-alcohol phosphatidyltransferase family protein [Arcanobacterium sp.]